MNTQIGVGGYWDVITSFICGPTKSGDKIMPYHLAKVLVKEMELSGNKVWPVNDLYIQYPSQCDFSIHPECEC